MIECLEANANILAVHLLQSLPAGCGPYPQRLTLILVLRHGATEWRPQGDPHIYKREACVRVIP